MKVHLVFSNHVEIAKMNRRKHWVYFIFFHFPVNVTPRCYSS